jgi:hypothetical protein
MKVLDQMGRKTKSAVLALSVLLVVAGGQAVRGIDSPQTADSPQAALQQASVTVPGPEEPLVVQAGLSSNTRGWTHGSGATPAADEGIRPELVDAYTLAVALAPTDCHVSLSLLAAIGQVESGNLAGQRITADHRVVPGVLGPVLDGSTYAEILDTDDGRWDGNKTWDRALGPLQLLPASWRTVGMDSDGDGVRDPQNVYDAAGAAMVYLCDGGRDLGTRKGLEEAILAYNHSRDYLRLVLAWKTVFDTADITGLGSTPPTGAWAAPTLFAPTPTRTGSTPQEESPSVDPSQSSEPQATAMGRPPTVKTTASANATTDPTAGPTAVPTASNPPAASTKPGKKPDSKPTAEPDAKPGDTPTDEPLPTCPTDEPTPTDDPSAEPTCCPAEPAEPTETPTATPSVDPSTDPSEELDPCATETPTPTAEPTP